MKIENRMNRKSGFVVLNTFFIRWILLLLIMFVHPILFPPMATNEEILNETRKIQEIDNKVFDVNRNYNSSTEKLNYKMEIVDGKKIVELSPFEENLKKTDYNKDFLISLSSLLKRENRDYKSNCEYGIKDCYYKYELK